MRAHAPAAGRPPVQVDVVAGVDGAPAVPVLPQQVVHELAEVPLAAAEVVSEPGADAARRREDLVLEDGHQPAKRKGTSACPTNVGVVERTHTLSLSVETHLGCSEVFVSLTCHLYIALARC